MSGPTTDLTNLTIQNGNAEWGSGISNEAQAANIQIVNCQIQNNRFKQW